MTIPVTSTAIFSSHCWAYHQLCVRTRKTTLRHLTVITKNATSSKGSKRDIQATRSYDEKSYYPLSCPSSDDLLGSFRAYCCSPFRCPSEATYRVSKGRCVVYANAERFFRMNSSSPNGLWPVIFSITSSVPERIPAM